MLKIDLSPEAMFACCDAAVGILKRDGKPDQNGETTFEVGDLRFAHTNANEIEVRLSGHVVMRVPVDPHAGSGRPIVWLPGDWLHSVDAID